MPHNRYRTRESLAAQVAQQLPEFVRSDHPTFTAFVQAYYEWLETQGQALNISFRLRDISDIDDTLEEFIDQFKKKFLLNFPVQLAIDSETGQPLDERRIIKNIKAFYKSKGSEKSYKFLFRILFDTNVEFFFPKVDILRASDGKFIIERFMRVTTANGPETFQAVGKKIQQRDSTTGDITASAKVNRAIQFQSGLYEVTEYVLSEVFGTFSPPQRIEFEIKLEDGTTKLITENIFTMVISVDMTNGGTGFVEGEVVRMINAPGDVGLGALGVIDRIDGATGAVLRVAIRDPGTNYLIPPFADFSESENGVGATATVNLGPIFTADGFYGNNDGKLSSNKVIQDSFFYQDYSYVLKTEVTIDKWIDTVNRVIHPAGLKVFGEVTIFRCVESEAPHETRFQAYEIPLIGHYTPYTWLTTEDLRAATVANLDLYPNGFDPTAPQGSTWQLTDLANFALPNFAVGETITGSPSGDTAVVVDFAAAVPGQPGSVLSVTGAPLLNAFSGDTLITGSTSGATLNPVGGILQTPTVAEDGSDSPHVPGPNIPPAFAGDFTDFPDLKGRPTLALGSGSGPFWFTFTGLTGTFQIGNIVTGSVSSADAIIYALDITGTKIGVRMIDGEFAVGETLAQVAPAASATITSLLNQPVPRWGFPNLPKSDPIFIIYHHPNRRGMIEIPGPGEPHPNPNMRIVARVMISGAFTLGETVIGDALRITDITPYVLGEDFILGEIVTGQLSSATGIVLEWNPANVVSLGSQLVIGQISGGPFTDGEDIVGSTSGAELTVDEITEDLREGIVDADPDLLNPGESQIIMVSGGEFTPGEHITGQTSTAVARVDAISNLIYPGGMPWRDIVIRDFARNMRVAEGVLCVPRSEQVILSDAGYPNEDIGGLDGSGPTD